MNWTLALQGFILGLGAAVPLGPVNIEIIRRCLLIRPLAGATLGAGAVSADMCYLTLAFVGAGALIAGNPPVEITLGLGGAAFLAWLGWMALKSGLDREGIEEKLSEAAHGNRETSSGRGHLGRHYVFGLLMTLLNPYTVAFWTSVSANVSDAATSGLVSDLAALALGVAMGAGGWVIFLTSLLALGRKRFAGPRFLMGVSVFGGLVLLGYAALRVWKIASPFIGG
jgi:L-lysine exporter family protein LysE/ArgO